MGNWTCRKQNHGFLRSQISELFVLSDQKHSLMLITSSKWEKVEVKKKKNQGIRYLTSCRDKQYGRRGHLTLGHPADPNTYHEAWQQGVWGEESWALPVSTGLAWVYSSKGFCQWTLKLPQPEPLFLKIWLGWTVEIWFYSSSRVKGWEGDGEKRVDLLACLSPINNNSSKVRTWFVFHGDTAGSLPSVWTNIYLGR